jgi:hypothetical protein
MMAAAKRRVVECTGTAADNPTLLNYRVLVQELATATAAAPTTTPPSTPPRGGPAAAAAETTRPQSAPSGMRRAAATKTATPPAPPTMSAERIDQRWICPSAVRQAKPHPHIEAQGRHSGPAGCAGMGLAPEQVAELRGLQSSDQLRRALEHCDPAHTGGIGAAAFRDALGRLGVRLTGAQIERVRFSLGKAGLRGLSAETGGELVDYGVFCARLGGHASVGGASSRAEDTQQQQQQQQQGPGGGGAQRRRQGHAWWSPTQTTAQKLLPNQGVQPRSAREAEVERTWEGVGSSGHAAPPQAWHARNAPWSSQACHIEQHLRHTHGAPSSEAEALRANRLRYARGKMGWEAGRGQREQRLAATRARAAARRAEEAGTLERATSARAQRRAHRMANAAWRQGHYEASARARDVWNQQRLREMPAFQETMVERLGLTVDAEEGRLLRPPQPPPALLLRSAEYGSAAEMFAAVAEPVMPAAAAEPAAAEPAAAAPSPPEHQ